MFGYQVKDALVTFALILLGNLLLVAAMLSTGIEGEFIPEAAWNTFLGFFGGFGPLLAILIALAIMAVVVLGTARLSRMGKHVLVGFLTLLALIVGGFILWKWVPWETLLGAFSAPSLWLLLFTAVESVVILVAVRTAIVRRRTTTTSPTTTTTTV